VIGSVLSKLGVAMEGKFQKAKEFAHRGLMSLNLMKACNRTGDGVVSRMEFLATASSTVQSAKKSVGNSLMSLDSVRAMDANGDGVLTATELAEAARLGLTGASNAASEAVISMKADAQEFSQLARENWVSDPRTKCFNRRGSC